MAQELPTLPFATAEEWRLWLEENHASSEGIWLKFAKKASGITSITPQEALEVSLCYGWIDGQRNKFDDNYFINKYTARSKRSMWSKRNRDLAERLIQENKMQPAGFREIERAKQDGRWQNAYDSPANMEMPQDFLTKLKKDEEAYAFFQTLNSTNTYEIARRLQTARKPETRLRRMEKTLSMMKNGEKFY